MALQRYFIHLRNDKPYTPRDAHALLLKARQLAGKDVIVRDSRVSRKYLEFDTSIPDSMDAGGLENKLAAISPVASVEHIVERNMERGEAIKHAIELFNDEKYWGTHEALEAVWKETPAGQERDLINGIILVAAALVHDQKDEREICLSILRRAMKKLENSSGMYHGINIDEMADTVATYLNTGKIGRFTI